MLACTLMDNQVRDQWPTTHPPRLVRARMEMIGEAVQIIDRMMTQRPTSFAGEHFAVQNTSNDHCQCISRRHRS
jgi:hypothetical protein